MVLFSWYNKSNLSQALPQCSCWPGQGLTSHSNLCPWITICHILWCLHKVSFTEFHAIVVSLLSVLSCERSISQISITPFLFAWSRLFHFLSMTWFWVAWEPWPHNLVTSLITFKWRQRQHASLQCRYPQKHLDTSSLYCSCTYKRETKSVIHVCTLPTKCLSALLFVPNRNIRTGTESEKGLISSIHFPTYPDIVHQIYYIFVSYDLGHNWWNMEVMMSKYDALIFLWVIIVLIYQCPNIMTKFFSSEFFPLCNPLVCSFSIIHTKRTSVILLCTSVWLLSGYNKWAVPLHIVCLP